MCLLTQLSRIMTALLPNSFRFGFQKNAFKSQRDSLCAHIWGRLPSFTHFMGKVREIRKAILN